MQTLELQRRVLLGAIASIALAASISSLQAPALADSHDQERQIGQQVYQDLRNKQQIIDQSPYYAVLRSVGARVSAAAQPHWYTMNFIIVKGKSVNAFSVPGGNVYVNEGLLREAQNEDELASVLAHETGHIVLGHVMNRLHQAQNLNIIGAIASIFIRNPVQANIANLVANYGWLNYNRQQEYQADHEGVILGAKAGYNPWGMIWFFRKLEKLYGNAGFEQYVQDHPSTNDRIGRIEEFFRGNPQQFARYHDAMTTTAGLQTSNTNDQLVLH